MIPLEHSNPLLGPNFSRGHGDNIRPMVQTNNRNYVSLSRNNNIVLYVVKDGFRQLKVLKVGKGLVILINSL